MTPSVSVVIPVYNGQETLADCLRALEAQSLPRDRYEIIVVDDGSTDASASIAEQFDVRVLRQENLRESAARNAGTRAAQGEWVAFTDADCVPTRTWLGSLLQAVDQGQEGQAALGAAGPIFGYASETPAARFVDLTRGLDTEGHLKHPVFPYAPLGNAMYRREALLQVGGPDERFVHYPGPDLHDRLLKSHGGDFYFEPRAVVLHHHRATWRELWRQQHGYGVGYAQFLIRRRDEIEWSVGRELRAWGDVARYALAACRPGRGDEALVRRGNLLKHLAHRLGFVTTYWSREERARWL
jgi:glycosyltransferase involved in cell wall biosynthesis